MPNRFFPIATDTGCRSKWSWSTLYLNQGRTASCHRASASEIPENFDNFHNTDIKIRDRSIMLQNAWPGNGCEYCRDIELAGGVSDRQFQNQIPDIYPPELDSDNTLTSVTPVVLEVFFSNTCNLSCVYCSAKYSSSIQIENKKFGGAILPEQNFEYSNNLYKELVPKFWNWFAANSQSLRRLQILGGEPFVQKDMLKLLDYFDHNPCPDLEFNIITNLSLPTTLLEPTLKKLSELKNQNKLKRIDIQVSVDCWGRSQEYIRYGLDLDALERNMDLMIGLGTFRIGLLTTITSLSIPTMSDLAAKYNQWCKKQKIFWYMHLVAPSTSVFDPTVFEYSQFESHLNTVYNLLPKDTWDDRTTVDSFNGIVTKLKHFCKDNVDRQTALIQYLESNDARRKSDWTQVFPWLTTFRKNVV